MHRILVFLFFCLPLCAEDLYVRDNSFATGSNTGADWTNAYKGFGSVTWGSGAGKVSAGDTLWVAGGTYTTRLQVGVSGTAGNIVSIKRPLATDATPVAAAGWSSGFDSQVVINPSPASTPVYITANIGSYVTIDGRTRAGADGTSTDGNNSKGWGGTYGIKCVHGDGKDGCELDNNAGNTFSDITFRYIETVGPGLITYSDDSRGFDLTPTGAVVRVKMQYCSAHDGSEAVTTSAPDTCTFEYCEMYKVGAVNAATFHPNIFIFTSMQSCIIRHNRMFDIRVEGFFGEAGTNTNNEFYGNLLYKGANGDTGGRGIEFSNGTYTGWKIYNNTFVDFNLDGINLAASGSTNDSTNLVKNNLIFNCGFTFGNSTHDYNGFSAGSTTETNGTAGITTPFTDASSADYTIITTVSATKPRNKGLDLGSSYNNDPLAVTRGADGTWDLGAYEYNAGAATLTIRVGP